MIILDTDHLSVLRYEDDPRCRRPRKQLDEATDRSHAITAITVQEQPCGWQAELARRQDVEQQVPVYARLVQLVRFFVDWEILPFELAAAMKFKEFRKEKIRIGTQDLKIASIALVNNALLLSANLRDFRKVPGLRVESWIK